MCGALDNKAIDNGRMHTEIQIHDSEGMDEA